jgi:hypothetical protein
MYNLSPTLKTILNIPEILLEVISYLEIRNNDICKLLLLQNNFYNHKLIVKYVLKNKKNKKFLNDEIERSYYSDNDTLIKQCFYWGGNININIYPNKKESLLYYSIKNDKNKIIPVVLEHINLNQNDLNKALIMSCKKGKYKIIKRILDKGVNFDCNDDINKYKFIYEVLKNNHINILLSLDEYFKKNNLEFLWNNKEIKDYINIAAFDEKQFRIFKFLLNKYDYSNDEIKEIIEYSYFFNNTRCISFLKRKKYFVETFDFDNKENLKIEGNKFINEFM